MRMRWLFHPALNCDKASICVEYTHNEVRINVAHLPDLVD